MPSFTRYGIAGKVLESIVPTGVSSVSNIAVNALPVELQRPGYRFCGPGTKLEDRLTRGEHGINDLD